jgi:hypothetical protein
MAEIEDPYRRPPYSDQFVSFYNELKQVMDVSGHLFINIYNDPSGNSYTLDSIGNPIQHRKVKYIIYTYSNAEFPGSQSDVGGIKIKFIDNSEIQFPNSEPYIFFWYSIDGIEPVVIKPFT